ncbi:MAG: nucleotidyltransferase family protein [Clostridia bacterium]|nr:nucleotidyltransferase family protein [Clostridia bacterium]
MQSELRVIQIVKSLLTGEEIPDCENLQSVFSCAQKHSLETMVYEAVKNSQTVPEEFKKEAKKQYFIQLAQLALQEECAKELFALFQERGIKYLPLKGYVLRELYPKKEWRISCDVDVFYDSSRRKEVEEIMRGLGYLEKETGVNNTLWERGTAAVETHHALAEQSEFGKPYYENVFARLEQKNGAEYAFNAEDFYVYYLFHAAKHFTGGGFGLRTLTDVYLYRKLVPLSEETLNAELEKLHLKVFKDEVEKVVDACFNGAKASEDTAFLIDYIFRSGTYGQEDANAAFDVSTENGEKKSRKKYLLQTIFPSYKIMKRKYPVVGKVPVLYPFAWVWRWIEVLLFRRDRIQATIQNKNSLNEGNIRNAKRVLEITKLPLDR